MPERWPNPTYPITRVLHLHGFRQQMGKGNSDDGRIDRFTRFTQGGVQFQLTRTYSDQRLILFFVSQVGRMSCECGYIIIRKGRDCAIVGTDRTSTSSITKPTVLSVTTVSPSVSGKTILNAIIAYVRRLQTKYTITSIQLRDNASVYIHPNGDKQRRPERVFLADYYTLTSGTTYYSQFGFVPFLPDTNRPDKASINAFLKNVKTIETARLKDSKILSRLVAGFDPDSRLADVTKSLFRSNPSLMNAIVEDVCGDIELHRFVGSSWYCQV